MAITYPLSTPTDIGIAQIELSARNAVAVSQSPFTFATQTHSYAGQMWQATVTIPPVRREYSEPWVAFLLSLKGPTGTFLLGDPAGATPRGSGLVDTNGVQVDNAAASGVNVANDSTIYVDGFTPSETGVLLPGDYIQLGTGSSARLHKVLTQVDADTNGAAEIDIWPAIRRDLVDDEAVTIQDPKGLFRLATPVQSWSINESSVYGLSFECMEVVA